MPFRRWLLHKLITSNVTHKRNKDNKLFVSPSLVAEIVITPQDIITDVTGKDNIFASLLSFVRNRDVSDDSSSSSEQSDDIFCDELLNEDFLKFIQENVILLKQLVSDKDKVKESLQKSQRILAFHTYPTRCYQSNAFSEVSISSTALPLLNYKSQYLTYSLKVESRKDE